METSKTYWISHIEKVALVYGYKVEALSVEEAIEKAKNSQYIESKFLGIADDLEVEVLENNSCTQELDFEDTENYVEPEYRFYNYRTIP